MKHGSEDGENRSLRKAIVYIHGQGGNAEEAGHYRPLFPDSDVIGFDYRARTPWQAKDEFPRFFDSIHKEHETVSVIANSIGAFFTMSALSDRQIEKAFFISPVVDMEKLIADMMLWADVSEDELREKGVIQTSFGQELSWEYLSYVRKHPIEWHAPTHILYGSEDQLTSRETIFGFAEKTGATLTVMENGEHWFHTEEQMRFLDCWIESIL